MLIGRDEDHGGRDDDEKRERKIKKILF